MPGDRGDTSATGVCTPSVSARALHAARRRLARRAAVVAALGFAAAAQSASALVIHGGPTYAGSGGVTGSCTTTGNACVTAGATVSCTGLNPGAFQNLYFGIRNDTFVNGVKEVGTGGPVAGTDHFKTATGTGGGAITYTGTT